MLVSKAHVRNKYHAVEVLEKVFDGKHAELACLNIL